MPLYIYSLIRRGITPEINALSTVLLAGSIGLVGLSLTAQSGGVLYTRAMSFGAGLGLGLFGVTRVFALFAPGGFTVGSLLVALLLLAGLYGAKRSFADYKEELAAVNRSGRILAWLTVAVVVFAAYVSAFLLLS
jgi:hypothetical protein